jgi:ABC-type antimicrobial peptide transport system permease subunit
MGIRMALGARRVQILRTVLQRTLLLLTGGSLAGLLLGIAASRILANVVYGATIYDPLVLTGAIAAMIFIGAIATTLPARRALQAEPARLLRDE